MEERHKQIPTQFSKIDHLYQVSHAPVLLSGLTLTHKRLHINIKRQWAMLECLVTLLEIASRYRRRRRVDWNWCHLRANVIYIMITWAYNECIHTGTEPVLHISNAKLCSSDHLSMLITDDDFPQEPQYVKLHTCRQSDGYISLGVKYAESPFDFLKVRLPNLMVSCSLSIDGLPALASASCKRAKFGESDASVINQCTSVQAAGNWPSANKNIMLITHPWYWRFFDAWNRVSTKKKVPR